MKEKQHKTFIIYLWLDRFPARPYIKEDYPKNVTVLRNETAEFSCPVLSDLAEHITWVKAKAYNDSDGNIKPGTVRLEVNHSNMFDVMRHNFGDGIFLL